MQPSDSTSSSPTRIGQISESKRPFVGRKQIFCGDLRANSSCRTRSIEYHFATFSAVIPMLIYASGKLSSNFGWGDQLNPYLDIDSIPPTRKQPPSSRNLSWSHVNSFHWRATQSIECEPGPCLVDQIENQQSSNVVALFTFWYAHPSKISSIWVSRIYLIVKLLLLVQSFHQVSDL